MRLKKFRLLVVKDSDDQYSAFYVEGIRGRGVIRVDESGQGWKGNKKLKRAPLNHASLDALLEFDKDSAGSADAIVWEPATGMSRVAWIEPPSEAADEEPQEEAAPDEEEVAEMEEPAVDTEPEAPAEASTDDDDEDDGWEEDDWDEETA